MKKLLLCALLCAAPTLGQDTPVAAPNLETRPETAPFKWQLHMEAGQRFRTTLETSSQTSQKMPAFGAKGAASSMETTSKSRVVLDQNVLSVDENGARVEMLYREVTQSMRMVQGDKEIYDSARPPAALKDMADIGKTIVGASVSYRLNSKGEISDIQDVEEVLDRIVAGLEKSVTPGPQKAATQAMLRQGMQAFLSPDFIKNWLGTSYRALPAQAVRRGESWNYSVALPMMGTVFTHNGKGTFVSRDNGTVTLAQVGDFSTDAGAEFKIPLPKPRGGAAPVSQLDLHGTSVGEIVVDEATGMTLKTRITQTLEGEMIMNGLMGKGSVLTIPMKVTTESTSTTEMLKVQLKIEP